MKLYVGYYGRNNLGDDLMLKVLYDDKNSYVFLLDDNFYSFIPKKKQLILSKNPLKRFLEKCFFLVKIKLNGCKELIFGGGTQFSSYSTFITQLEVFLVVLIARILNYKVSATSVGIGKINKDNKLLVLSIKMFNCISVRDFSSSIKLRKFNIKHEISSDLVYKLKINKNSKAIPQNIVITATGPVLRKNSFYQMKFIEFVKRNVKADFNNIIFCVFQENEDEYLFEILKKYIPGIKIKTPKTSTEIDDIYNNCIEVVGMRYHSLVLADIYNVKFKGVSYDDKVKDICLRKKMPFESLN
tara:strand:+ start:286 stop:1182 length:897 start_codon:yes stop_codon:yes gene_type:complete